MKPLERVIITYFSKPPILDYLSQAFGRIGVEVRVLHAEENSWFDKHIIHRVNKLAHSLRLLPKSRHLFQNHPLVHHNFRSRRLLDLYEEFKPDLVLVIRGPGFSPEVLAKIRPLFGWWVEHDHRREVIGELERYDWFFFINQSFVDMAQSKGHTHIGHLFHAVTPESFYPITGVRKTVDMCFVGGWSPRRQQYIEAALSITPNVVVYGGKWAKRCAHLPDIVRCLKGKYIGGEALNRLYNESRVVLNVTNWGNDRIIHSGMTMRVVEVPATGTFLLSDISSEMLGTFELGKHIGVFRDVEEFPRQLKYWLEHEAERTAVGLAGRRHVLDNFTYDRLVEKIVDRYRSIA